MILAQAGIICFLLSPAAMDVNGTTLPVDQVVDQLCALWNVVDFLLLPLDRSMHSYFVGCSFAGN